MPVAGWINSTNTKLVHNGLNEVMCVHATSASPRRHFNPTPSNSTTVDGCCNSALLTVVVGAFLIDTSAEKHLTMTPLCGLDKDSCFIPINDSDLACAIDAKETWITSKGVTLGKFNWQRCLMSSAESPLSGESKEAFSFTNLTI